MGDEIGLMNLARLDRDRFAISERIEGRFSGFDVVPCDDFINEASHGLLESIWFVHVEVVAPVVGLVFALSVYLYVMHEVLTTKFSQQDVAWIAAFGLDRWRYGQHFAAMNVRLSRFAHSFQPPPCVQFGYITEDRRSI